MRALTTASTNVRRILLAAKAAGIPTDGALSASVERVLDDPDARLPWEVVRDLWIELEKRSGDEHLGLHFAERQPVGSFSVIDYRLRASANLREMLLRTSDYAKLVNEALVMELEEDEREARFVHRVHGIAAISMTEGALALVFLRTREFSGQRLLLREVRFCRSAPGSAAELERVFDAPARFAQKRDELVFDRKALSTPFLAADREVALAFDDYLAKRISRLSAGEFSGSVRYEITKALAAGNSVDLDAISGALGMTSRTVQRRLEDEATRYQEVLDQVRRELADADLRKRDLSIAEIAWNLGFSDATAFHKAYKRWTGKTPAQARTG